MYISGPCFKDYALSVRRGTVRCDGGGRRVSFIAAVIFVVLAALVIVHRVKEIVIPNKRTCDMSSPPPPGSIHNSFIFWLVAFQTRCIEFSASK